MGPKSWGFWVATHPILFVRRLHPLKALPYIKTRVLSPQPRKSVSVGEYFEIHVFKILFKILSLYFILVF